METVRSGPVSVLQLIEPLRLGTGSKTYKVEQPSVAVVASSSEAMVTSAEGSGISRPRWSASKDELHSSRSGFCGGPPQTLVFDVRRCARRPPRANTGRQATRGGRRSSSSWACAVGRSTVQTTASAMIRVPDAVRTPASRKVGERKIDRRRVHEHPDTESCS
jgi:hypothetical protein